MDYQIHICNIISHKEIAPNIMEVWIENQELAKHAQAGQFLHIECGDTTAMPLRRPISICDVEGNTLRFIYEIKGKGTAALSTKTDCLNVLGPLGRGFMIDNKTYSRPAVLGGGIGVYPMLLTAKKLGNASCYLGFRSKSLVTLEDDFSKVAKTLSVSTDDGSYGTPGFALDRLKEDIENEKFDILYACGPKGMLKAVVNFAKENNIPCQISLEERMGCGIGACLTCSCKTPHEGVSQYKRVCSDGPVFWAEEVIL